MNYEVRVNLAAKREALAAAQYIAERAGARIATAWMGGLKDAIDTLQEFPLRCPEAREARYVSKLQLRQLPYKSHRIIFEIDGEIVRVLHVLHMAQQELAPEDI